MIYSIFSVRVRYGETDQMGVVYHGNYPAYCEVARIEFFRELGLPYKELEEKGIMLPVIDMSFTFLKSAFFDDLLEIKTILRTLPTGVRLVLDYEIYNQNKLLLSKATITLAFVDKNSKKPVRCPTYMLSRLEELFEN